MPQAATIKSLPHAFRMVKAMQAQGIEWGEDDRRAGPARTQPPANLAGDYAPSRSARTLRATRKHSTPAGMPQ